MQLDLLSGARLSFSVFDVDNDGKFENTNDDKVETSVGTEDLPSGVRVQPGATDNFGGMAGSSKDILVGSTLPGDRPTISIRGGLTSGRQSWRQLY
jgi:Tfp pilus tip-associated adhesin PilY1